MSVSQDNPTAIDSILQVFVPLSGHEVVVTKDSKHVNGFLVDPLTGNGTSIFAATNVAKILVPENVADLSVENTGSSDIDGTYKLLHQNKYAQIHTNHVVWVREEEEEEKLAVYFVYDNDLGFQDAGETGRWVLGAWPQPTGSPIAVHYVQKEASTNRFPFVDQWVLPNEVITKPPQTETQLNDDYSEAKLFASQEYNRRVELSQLDPNDEDYKPFDSSKVNDPLDSENYIENYDPGYDPNTPEEESVTVPETRVTSLDVELDDDVESLDILKMQLKRGGDVTNVLNDTHNQPAGVTQNNINLNVDGIGKHMVVIAGQKVDVRLMTSTSTSGVTDLGELHLACLDVNTVSTLGSYVRLTGAEGSGFSAWNGLSSNKTPDDFTDWVYDDSSIHASISLPNAQSTKIYLLPYIHQNFDNQQVIMDRVAQPSLNELVDTSSFSFSESSVLPASRNSHSSVRLSSGHILVIGGNENVGSSVRDTVYISNNGVLWNSVTITGTLAVMQGRTSVVIPHPTIENEEVVVVQVGSGGDPEGKFLLMNNISTTNNTATVADVDNSSNVELPNLRSPVLAYHPASRHLILAGGNRLGNPDSSLNVFQQKTYVVDLSNDSNYTVSNGVYTSFNWIEGGNLGVPLFSAASVVNSSGDLLIIGGETLEDEYSTNVYKYIPSSKSFQLYGSGLPKQNVATHPSGGLQHHAAVRFGNELWVIGGAQGSNFTSDKIIKSLDNGRSWLISEPSLSSALSRHTAVASPDAVFIIGGISNSVSLNKVIKYSGTPGGAFFNSSIFEMISHDAIYDEAYDTNSSNPKKLPHTCLGRVSLKHRSANSTLCINRDRVSFLADADPQTRDPSYSPELLYRNNVTFKWVGSGNSTSVASYQVRNIKKIDAGATKVTFELDSGDNLTIKVRPVPALKLTDQITLADLVLKHVNTISDAEGNSLPVKFVLDGMQPDMRSIPDDTEIPNGTDLHLRQKIDNLSLNGTASKSHFEIVGVLLKQVEISNSLSSPVVIIEDCVVDSRGLANPLKVHDADLKFRSGPTKTTGDLLTSRQDYEIARQDPGRCQTINLNLELNQTVGKVEFDGVLMRCVPSNPTTRFLLSNASTGQYALRASSTISLAGDTLAISFVNRQSYLGIEAANCNGVLLDTQARKIKLQSLTSDPDNVPSSNMHRRSYLQTVRAFDASSISQFSNVGVIFRGTDVTDVPMDISDVSLCNNVDDSTQTNANDAGLAYVAFGTSAMSVDQTNVSNLASIVANLAGQGLKWISHQGHHIVGWKMDEPRVLYRKTHAQSHRKLVYTDSEGQAALPGQRMEHAFILGMIPGVTDDFTGETGGLFGLDLELLAHEALQQTFGGNTDILNTKLNELENILFGSADGAGFRVGIAGYLHSDHGGFENLRIFNGQPCGKYTIMFETDEGFRVKDPADVIRTLHYWLGLATMQARFQEPSTATVKLFRGKGDFSPWAISPMRYQLVERDTVSVGVWEQTDTGFASILHNDQTNSISVKGTTKTLSVHLLDHAMLWDSGIYLTRPTDDDLKNQYLSNLNVTVDSATAVSFSAVTHPSGIFVQFKPPESGTQYDFTQYRGSFDISHTLNGSDKTGWPQNETTQVGLQFPQYFKDDDNFTHATYEAPVPQNASGYPLASESVLPLPNDTDTFLVSLTADVAVDASVVNVILVDPNDNSITNIKTNNPTFYGEVKDGQKNAANFTNVELMTPASSNPADYKSDTVEGNAVVTSETFTLGITMFSKPGNTLNPDLIHVDSIWKPDVPNEDYQYLVIVPRATESRVYDPNNLSQNVNTFHATDTTSWTVALNDTIGRPEPEYDSDISIINEADIKWHTAQTDRPDGKYSVIKVPAKMFARLLSGATSRIILIDITAKTTDSAAHLGESIMGAPMRASFSIIPLVADDSPTPNPTSANNYALYASVPVKFRMYFENAQTSTSGRPLKLTGRVLESQIDDDFDMSLFTNSQLSSPKLVVDFVARPASSTPNAQVDINFRTVHNTQSEPQDQFTIRQVDSSIDEHFDTVDHSPLIFTQVQFRTTVEDYGNYQMTIIAQVNQDAENKRKLTLEFPWLANTSSPNSQRIFYVGVDSFKYGDVTANVASSINGEARRLWTLKPANHEAERMFQFALNTNLNLPNNGEVLWDAPLTETSGSGNGPAVSSNLTIDMQIRLQSASLSDGTSIVRTGDSSLENQMRDYQYTYVWSNDNQEPAPTEIYDNPSILNIGTGILNRPLKSILERVWIGWSFFDTSLVDSAGALGNFAVELDAEVLIGDSVQSVKPEFYKSHSGDESFSSAVYNAAPVTASPPHSFSYNTYRGAWIDFSNLQTLLSSQTGVLICDIYAIMRPPNEAEQQQGALTNQIQGKFGVGLKVLIAKVDLSNAGRVELLNMDNVSMSSVRIGNWIMRPDSSGHLRFNHEVFGDTGEASTEQNANIEFTMSAASVANIQTADETDVVDVVGTSFRLTGHPNE